MNIFRKKLKGGVSTILATIVCAIASLFFLVYLFYQGLAFMVNQQVDTIAEQAVSIACRSGGVTEQVDTYVDNKLRSLVNSNLVSEFTVTYYYYDINDVFKTSVADTSKIKSVGPFTVSKDSEYSSHATNTIGELKYVTPLLQQGKSIGVSIQETGESNLARAVRFATGKTYTNLALASYKESMVYLYSYTGTGE